MDGPVMLAAVALAAGGDVPLAVPACPIDRVEYRIAGAPGFTAGFARTPHPSDAASDLRFFLRTPRRTYWFAFAVAQGYGGVALVPETSPHAADDAPPPAIESDSAAARGIAFDAFRADLTTLTDPPRARDRPPARLFSRELGRALWYEPTALAGGDASAVQEALPTGLFAPAGCAAAPH